MNFKAWFKSHTADRVLAPLRKALLDLIQPNASLLEVGCGTGDLLFQAAGKINSGLGIDIDPKMIRYAESKRQNQNLNHLRFERVDALSMAPGRFNVGTSTLCLHELPQPKACALLKMLLKHSDMVLVADYTQAKSMLGRWSIGFDELLSGHYRNYRNYRKNGEIPAYAREVGAIVQKEIPSTIDGISIWCIGSNASS